MVSSKKDMIENLSMDMGFSGRKKSSVLRLALCGGENPQRGLWDGRYGCVVLLQPVEQG